MRMARMICTVAQMMETRLLPYQPLKVRGYFFLFFLNILHL